MCRYHEVSVPPNEDQTDRRFTDRTVTVKLRTDERDIVRPFSGNFQLYVIHEPLEVNMGALDLLFRQYRDLRQTTGQRARQA